MPDPGTAPVPAEYGSLEPGGLRRARRVAPRRAREGPDEVDGTEPPLPPRPPRRRARPPVEERVSPVEEPVRPVEESDEGVREVIPRKGWHRERVKVVRGRRSRRIVRRLDTWTVLKVSLVFYLCVLIVIVVSGVVLWNVAEAFGFLHSIEKSVKSLFDYTSFTLHPRPILEYTILGGAGLAVLGTLGNVLVALLYNLISDVVGGIQIVVIAEEE